MDYAPLALAIVLACALLFFARIAWREFAHARRNNLMACCFDDWLAPSLVLCAMFWMDVFFWYIAFNP